MAEPPCQQLALPLVIAAAQLVPPFDPDWYLYTYLQTPHWLACRDAQLRRVPWCQVCGRTHQLEVHHLHRHTLYFERHEDLLTVCRHCHAQLHGRSVASPVRRRRAV